MKLLRDELNVPTITLVTVFGQFSSIQAGNVGGVLVAGGQLEPNRELLLLDHAGDRARGA